MLLPSAALVEVSIKKALESLITAKDSHYYEVLVNF